jgi:hypothetical protein
MPGNRHVPFLGEEAAATLSSLPDFLLAYLQAADTSPPSIAQHDWEGAEPRLEAAMECVYQRAKEGQNLPRSFGITGARERRPQSLLPTRKEPIFLYRGVNCCHD